MADTVEEPATLDVNISEEEDVLPPEEPLIEDSSVEQTGKGENDEKPSPEPADETTKPAEKGDKPSEANVGWVDIIEKENNLKLLSELNKIGKLITMKDKIKELQDYRVSHRLCIGPIYPEDLVDPYLTDVMKMCSSTQINFIPQQEGDNCLIQGVLELKFRKISDLLENKEKLGQLRENIDVGHNLALKDYENFMKKWRSFGRAHEEEKNQLTLFAPSLPESVTEAEMYDLFPAAAEIALVPGTPRQHAYIRFLEEDILRSAIEDLKARGPPRPDFNFCRLVRFSKIVDIINEDRKIKKTQKKPRPGVVTALMQQPSVATEGQRSTRKRAQPQRRYRRNIANKSTENGRTEPTERDVAKKAGANVKEEAPSGRKKNVSQGKKSPTTRTGQPNKRGNAASGGNAPRRSNWYRDRRAKYLEQARRQGRTSQSQRSYSQMASSSHLLGDRQQGLQMLDTLLTSLGQLSSSGLYPSSTTNVTRGGRVRGGGQGQRSPRSSGQRSMQQNKGRDQIQSQGGQQNQARGPQSQARIQQNQPRSQQNHPRGQHSTSFAHQIQPDGQQRSPQGTQARRRRGRRRGRANNVGRSVEQRESNDSQSYRLSPIKRAYPSVESLPRPEASSLSSSNKRRRETFQESSRPDTSLDMYRTDTRRSDTYSGYQDFRRPSYGVSNYERQSTSSTPSQSLRFSMLTALGNLNRSSQSGRSLQDDNRYSSSSYNQQMSRPSYDRSSYY